MRTEVWLYGSVARGSQTTVSDLDILVVPSLEAEMWADVSSTINLLPRAEQRAISTYSWKQLVDMAAYGSLFLLHLRKEARLLLAYGEGPGLAELVEGLPPYSHTDRDLAGFALALRDIGESLRQGGDPLFELSVTATVVRHSSILTSYLGGAPRFDREGSIKFAFEHVGLHHCVADALSLHQYRLAHLGRGTLTSKPDVGETFRLMRVAQSLVQEVTAWYGSS